MIKYMYLGDDGFGTEELCLAHSLLDVNYDIYGFLSEIGIAAQKYGIEGLLRLVDTTIISSWPSKTALTGSTSQCRNAPMTWTTISNVCCNIPSAKQMTSPGFSNTSVSPSSPSSRGSLVHPTQTRSSKVGEGSSRRLLKCFQGSSSLWQVARLPATTTYRKMRISTAAPSMRASALLRRCSTR